MLFSVPGRISISDCCKIETHFFAYIFLYFFQTIYVRIGRHFAAFKLIFHIIQLQYQCTTTLVLDSKLLSETTRAYSFRVTLLGSRNPSITRTFTIPSLFHFSMIAPRNSEHDWMEQLSFTRIHI